MFHKDQMTLYDLLPIAISIYSRIDSHSILSTILISRITICLSYRTSRSSLFILASFSDTRCLSFLAFIAYHLGSVVLLSCTIKELIIVGEN
jgi:hypothetical protein